MGTAKIVIVVLLVLDIGVFLLARQFDRRYYIPFLTTALKHRKEPLYNPNLFTVGLLAMSGGALIWALLWGSWMWLFHK